MGVLDLSSQKRTRIFCRCCIIHKNISLQRKVDFMRNLSQHALKQNDLTINTMNDTFDKIPLLTIRFHNDISFVELPQFRGAVISKVPSSLILFHNHEGDKLRYHYPLIQYKRIGGKAAILCLGKGTEAVGEFFANADFHLRIGWREEDFVISEMTAKQWLLQPWTTDF